jgi:hypothetical protein
VSPRVLQCAGAISLSVERAHEPQRNAAAVRIVRSQFAPPFHGGNHVAALLGGKRQRFQSHRITLRQSCALAVQPALEFGGVGKVKAV